MPFEKRARPHEAPPSRSLSSRDAMLIPRGSNGQFHRMFPEFPKGYSDPGLTHRRAGRRHRRDAGLRPAKPGADDRRRRAAGQIVGVGRKRPEGLLSRACRAPYAPNRISTPSRQTGLKSRHQDQRSDPKLPGPALAGRERDVAPVCRRGNTGVCLRRRRSHAGR